MIDFDNTAIEDDAKPAILDGGVVDFRYSGKLSRINLFKDDDESPYAVLEYNAGDLFILEYLDNIVSGIERVQSARNMNTQQKYREVSKLYAENFDAIFGQGTARLIARYDTSGYEFRAYGDVAGELRKALEKTAADLEAKEKERKRLALLEAKEQGQPYRVSE